MKSKKVGSSSDIPENGHYQIVVFDTRHIHHEGDERSRLCPGHGYPEYTETINLTTIYATEHKDAWESDIRELYLTGKSFLAYIVQAIAKVETNINIKLNNMR